MYAHHVRMALVVVFLILTTGLCVADELQPIKLNSPDTTRGLPFMKTLAVKASVREWSAKDLSLQDLSDLMWAANGLNRPGENKTTASSAMNAHDVDIFAFMKNGVYRYDFKLHELQPVLAGDYRGEIVDRPAPTDPPVLIVLISDPDRFPVGTDETRYEWGALDAGIISQNISLFCASTGLKTVPRAMMKKDRIRELLKLKENQHIFLNHPVGYKE